MSECWNMGKARSLLIVYGEICLVIPSTALARSHVNINPMRSSMRVCNSIH